MTRYRRSPGSVPPWERSENAIGADRNVFEALSLRADQPALAHRLQTDYPRPSSSPRLNVSLQ